MPEEQKAFSLDWRVIFGLTVTSCWIGAGLICDEHFLPGQWLGVAILVSGIFGLAAWNLRHVEVDRDRLVPALWLAAATGVFVAAYTTYDAYGIRATADPFTFLAWFFMIDGVLMPSLTVRRWRVLPRAEITALLQRGVIGAFVAYFSFGSIMLATRLDKVGEAAVLRETSTVFAALIGWLVLGEKVSRGQLALMSQIAAGAVLVEVMG